MESNYESGKRNSSYSSWFENGQAEMRGAMLRGKDGIWNYWLKDGSIKEQKVCSLKNLGSKTSGFMFSIQVAYTEALKPIISSLVT